MFTYMFTNSRYVVMFFGALLSVHPAAWSQTDADNWVNPPPPKCLKTLGSEKRRVPGEDIYEVVNSKYEWATSDLKNESIKGGTVVKELTESRAKLHLGAWYKLSNDKKPYLVRAVYGKPKGRFDAWWCGEDLVISHSDLVSLGVITEENKTALIINLEKAPNTVYVEMEI